jgi:hypothetical protein
MPAPPRTFIVDCPYCQAKVAALLSGEAFYEEFLDEIGEPVGDRIQVGNCPSCKRILVAHADQIYFKGWMDDEADGWTSTPVRVYPQPPKTFASNRIPTVVTKSLLEAERCMQAGAPTAACAMLGRSLEGLCRDVLEDLTPPLPAGAEAKPPPRIMLGKGIKALRDKNVIDDRLYNWSQHLQAFRNLAAHPEDAVIDASDARDLQMFVHAIVEYIYDLTDRYDEFLKRVKKREEAKKKAEGKKSAS